MYENRAYCAEVRDITVGAYERQRAHRGKKLGSACTGEFKNLSREVIGLPKRNFFSIWKDRLLFKLLHWEKVLFKCTIDKTFYLKLY